MSNDEILNRLTRVRQGFEEILRREGTLSFSDDLQARTETGLSQDEVQAWLESQPAFAKRIVTPLHGKPPPDKLAVYL